MIESDALQRIKNSLTKKNFLEKKIFEDIKISKSIFRFLNKKMSDFYFYFHCEYQNGVKILKKLFLEIKFVSKIQLILATSLNIRLVLDRTT